MKTLSLSILAVGAFVLTFGNVACTAGHDTTPPPEAAGAKPGSANVSHGGAKTAVTSKADRQ